MTDQTPTRPIARQSTDSSFINIEAWADDAVQAIDSLIISSPAAASPERLLARGASVSLEIPLEEESKPRRTEVAGEGETRPRVLVPAKELRRRDSLKRREALLKGKEGSRRRQRWENDRLLNNPHAEPPLPSDWEVRPTYPQHNPMPYYLAPLWDAKYAAKAEKSRSNKNKRQGAGANGVVDEKGARIQKELRTKLKKSRAAKGLLQDLEEQVRQFVQKWEDEQKGLLALEQEKEDDVDLLESSDEDEVVFVGRNGQCQDMKLPRKSSSARGAEREKLVFDSLEEDAGASFGRWLVHSIGTYYGLETYSITVGTPARREAYVAIKDVAMKAGSREGLATSSLPRPLWALV